jgi:anti-anti-sigma regulatory factor
MVVRMTTNAVLIQDAVDKVKSGEQEVTLDFSAVVRIDANVVRALEELADRADTRSVKVALRAVNVDIYRVLKQLKLTERFRFLT